MDTIGSSITLLMVGKRMGKPHVVCGKLAKDYVEGQPVTIEVDGDTGFPDYSPTKSLVTIPAKRIKRRMR